MNYSKDFITLLMKGGLGIVFPQKWKIANVSQNPEDCAYAAVCKVVDDDDLPAYIVFSDTPFSWMDEEEIDEIIDSIVRNDEDLCEYAFREKFIKNGYINENGETVLLDEKYISKIQLIPLRNGKTVINDPNYDYLRILLDRDTPSGEPAIMGCYKVLSELFDVMEVNNR